MFPKLRLWCCLVSAAVVPVTGAFAASAKTYQVTGPVIEVTPTTITIEKNKENWEIARDPSAQAEPAVKVGDRVTVHYRMTATKIEPKPGKANDGHNADTPAAATAKKKAKAE